MLHGRQHASVAVPSVVAVLARPQIIDRTTAWKRTTNPHDTKPSCSSTSDYHTGHAVHIDHSPYMPYNSKLIFLTINAVHVDELDVTADVLDDAPED